MGKKKKQGRVIGRRRDNSPASWSDPGGLVSVRTATSDDIAKFLAGDIGEFDPLDSVGSDVWDRSGSSRPSAEDLAYLESQGFVEVEPNRWRSPLVFGGFGDGDEELSQEEFMARLEALGLDEEDD
jgi:hypothetical protein